MKKEKNEAVTPPAKVKIVAVSTAPPVSRPAPDKSAPCILVYDDDTEMLFLCKQILARWRYNVKTLSSCENVIGDVERVKPDIIFMDLWIPTIGGEKAILLLKQNKSTLNIPVIIFSANTDIAKISRKIKADGYLEKPFDVSKFKEIIDLHILKQ